MSLRSPKHPRPVEAKPCLAARTLEKLAELDKETGEDDHEALVEWFEIKRTAPAEGMPYNSMSNLLRTEAGISCSGGSLRLHANYHCACYFGIDPTAKDSHESE